MKGACLCGRVTIELSAHPAYVNFCNCRLCRSAGAAWSYFDASHVAIAGTFATYVREDTDDPSLELHFCPRCGATTHYTSTPVHASTRVGVNARLFPQDALQGVPVKYQDGRQVEVEGDTFIVTATGHIGDGKAF